MLGHHSGRGTGCRAGYVVRRLADYAAVWLPRRRVPFGRRRTGRRCGRGSRATRSSSSRNQALQLQNPGPQLVVFGGEAPDGR